MTDNSKLPAAPVATALLRLAHVCAGLAVSALLFVLTYLALMAPTLHRPFAVHPALVTAALATLVVGTGRTTLSSGVKQLLAYAVATTALGMTLGLVANDHRGVVDNAVAAIGTMVAYLLVRLADPVDHPASWAPLPLFAVAIALSGANTAWLGRGHLELGLLGVWALSWFVFHRARTRRQR